MNRHMIVSGIFAIIEKDNKILLMQRKGTDFRDGFYAYPGGHIEPGESAKWLQ